MYTCIVGRPHAQKHNFKPPRSRGLLRKFSFIFELPNTRNAWFVDKTVYSNF